MIVSLVRFNSNLSDDEVQTTFEERADRFRVVPGLLEKIYLRFRDTGEFGAVYVWESEDDLQRFRDTDLAHSIPEAYRIEGRLGFEVADVPLALQKQSNHPPVSI